MFYKLFVIGLFSSIFVDIGAYEYEVRYLDVKLDQFTYTSNQTFKLKYLYNDKFWDKKAGPIFFYCGNEGAIEVFAANTGFQWESAERFKALVVFAEHRYYGESLPFGNHTWDSVETRGYLSSEQALEDFVDVLEFIQTDSNRKRQDSTGVSIRHPVIAFGGSYGGMLASWFRMKYPHIVQGALASSAPIWGFPEMCPCNFFFKTVTDVFKNTSASCHDGIKKSWGEIDSSTQNDAGKKWLTKSWKLCSPVNSSSDVQGFKNWLNEMYATMAMVNYPYPNSFLRPLPGHPIKKFCEAFDSSKEENLILKLNEASQIYFNFTKTEKCFNWATSSIDDMGLQGWNFQSCTEMVIPFCSTEEEMFEVSSWNFDAFAAECQRSLGVTPIANIAEKLYGGYAIEAASNIIFSNGLLDPWSGGGVLSDISSTLLAVVIPEGAHHLDLRAANKQDPQSVIDARNLYEKIFTKWINEFRGNQLKHIEKLRSLGSTNDETNEISKFLKDENSLMSKYSKSTKIILPEKAFETDLASSGKRFPTLGMFHPNSVFLRMRTR